LFPDARATVFLVELSRPRSFKQSTLFGFPFLDFPRLCCCLLPCRRCRPPQIHDGERPRIRSFPVCFSPHPMRMVFTYLSCLDGNLTAFIRGLSFPTVRLYPFGSWAENVASISLGPRGGYYSPTIALMRCRAVLVLLCDAWSLARHAFFGSAPDFRHLFRNNFPSPLCWVIRGFCSEACLPLFDDAFCRFSRSGRSAFS